MISKNLAQRIAVAVIFIPAILFMVFRGGDTFLYFILLLAAIGLWEYMHNGKIGFGSPFFYIAFAGTMTAVYAIASGEPVYGLYALTGAFLIVGIFLGIGKDPIDVLYRRMTYIVWGSFYIGLLYPYVYLIRGQAEWNIPAPGRWWLFYLLASLWVCDTAAMFFGSHFGRHKLAPTVSPNKTVEGFIGGFIGAFVIASIFKIFWLKDIAVYHFVAISIGIALFGQLGDLVESLWKRSIPIKDSSAIIPGHGGVLDRFDSLLFAAPVVYLYLKYIVHAVWL